MTISKSQKKLLTAIITGGLLFFVSSAAKEIFLINPVIYVVLMTASYIILGYDIMLTAAKNIKKGKVFDENFLMCIATIGAYILGDYSECVAVVLLFNIGEFFQSYAVAKSRNSIKDLMDICPEYANVERDDSIITMDPSDVNIGDIILAKPGEKIPLDGVVTDGFSCLDMASLTGESMPCDIKIGDEILSGSINLKSNLRIKVTKSFENSTVSKILELIENSGFNKAKSEQFITRFAIWYTPLVVTAALITAFLPPLILGGNLLVWLKRALIFLVISCPCALVISVPLSFFASIGCASKKGILIKGANYLEQLGQLDTIVFDKTGTLTEGNFKVTEIASQEGTSDELIQLASAAEFYSNHPIADSIKEKCPVKNYTEISDFENISGLGVSAMYKGIKIFAGSDALMQREGISAVNPETEGTVVHVCVDKVYKGYIVISDSIKAEAENVIKEIKNMGIKTCMLTGDLEKNAVKVSSSLGIDKVFSRLLPQDKVDKLNEIIKSKSKNKTVAYVGDGINDAPVITLADVGIAMGNLGSDAAIEAADIVICDDNLKKLPLAIKICKKTNRIVRQNVIFAIGVKFAVMALGVLGFANMWAAIFADVGVAFLAILNAMRSFKIKG